MLHQEKLGSFNLKVTLHRCVVWLPRHCCMHTTPSCSRQRGKVSLQQPFQADVTGQPACPVLAPYPRSIK